MNFAEKIWILLKKYHFYLQKYHYKKNIIIQQNKLGFLFPINIYVNYFFNIDDDFCFSALLVKLKTNSQWVLLNEEGGIEEFS